MEIVTIAGLIVAVAATVIGYLQLRRTPPPPPRVDAGPTVPLPLASPSPRNNLPPRELFLGRQKEMQRVSEGLRSSYPLLAIEGFGGMGKTALAKEIAWSCVEPRDTASSLSLPSYHAIVWVDDLDGRLSLNDALDTIAAVLEYPYIVSLSPEMKEAEVNKHLRAKACLIVVDNVETGTDPRLREFVEQIPEPPSRALVTTRERVLRGAWAIGLGKMEQQDAFLLIQSEGKRLGLRIIEDAGHETLAAIYEATGGNPLAIRLSLGLLRNSGMSLNEILERLASADHDELFDLLFKKVWQDVLKDDEHCKSVLMTMAVLSATCSKEAVEAGSDVHHAYLRVALKRLIELSLVDVSDSYVGASPRLQLHPLTRAFVRKQLLGSPEAEAGIRGRLVEYFVVYAEARANTYSSEASIQELELERHSITAFAALAAELSSAAGNRAYHEIVVRYSLAMSAFLWGRGYWNDELRLCENAIASTLWLGDQAGLARQLCVKGRISLWRGKVALAKECADSSREAVAGLSSASVVAIPLRLDAQIATRLGEYERAEDLLSRVLVGAPMTTDDGGRAATLLELGIVAAKQSKWQLARERLEEALKLDEELGTVEGQAITLSHLANVVLELDDVPRAKQLFERGLALANQVRRTSTVGRCQIGLARINLQSNNGAVALSLAESAAENFAKLGMADMVDESRRIAALVVAGRDGGR